MNPTEPIDPKLRADLASIYEEIMWLSVRPNVTPSRARAWYTHVMAESLKRQLRRFTGLVSERAAQDSAAVLRLEHYQRIQNGLTELVTSHGLEKKADVEAFIKLVLDFEQVHIVTNEENYAALRAKGNYSQAGIILVRWEQLVPERRRALWMKMLRGKVANAETFRT